MLAPCRSAEQAEEGFAAEAAQAELQAAVLDLTMEDQEGMRQQQKNWRWVSQECGDCECALWRCGAVGLYVVPSAGPMDLQALSANA